MITRNGSAIPGATGLVGAGGSFAISVSATLNAGDIVAAHGGTATGPSANSLSVAAASGGPVASTQPTVAAGASVISVSGSPGEVVVISADLDGPGGQPPVVLGTGVIPPGGELGVSLSTPLPPSTTVEIVVGGVVQGSVTTSPGTGAAPQLLSGSVLEEGSTLLGTGTPGALVQAVDAQGRVLGSATVDAQGAFTLAVSGALAGVDVSLVMNGVKSPQLLPSLKLGSHSSFTSANVFRPEQGAALSIGFKPTQSGKVSVKVYNLAGELVRPIFEAEALQGLLYQAQWDGKNGDGSGVASGVYFISVRGAGLKSIKKVVVLK